MTEVDGPAETTAGERSSAERGLLVAVVVVLVLPLVVGAVRALVDGVPTPGGDQAILEVRVRDVGDDTPVLGSYSRFGVNHPGPLWLYSLAAPYRVFGADFAALQVGTLLAGIASLAGVAWIAWARGGRVVLLWTAAGLAVLIHSLGPGWVSDPWEPKGLTLLVAALLFVTFDTVAGRTWSLPVVGLLASLLAQAYATLAVFAVAMGLLALGATVFRVARAGAGSRRRRRLQALGATAGLVLLVWSPPLLEQVRNDPGNLTAFAEALEDSPEPALGTEAAWRAVSLELGPRAAWLGNDLPLAGLVGVVDAEAGPAVPVGLVALAAVALLVWRRCGRPPALRLAVTVIVGIAAAVVSLSRLIGPLFVWIPSWTKVLGFGTWAATGWCAFELLGRRTRVTVARVAVPALAVLLTGVSLLSVRDAGRGDRPPAEVSATIQRLVDDVVPDLEGAVLARSDLTVTGVFTGESAGLPALVLALDRAGVDVVVEVDRANQYGNRRAQPDRASTELRLVDATAPVPAGFEVVATADPLTEVERTEVARLLARVPALAEEGADALREVARLREDPEYARLIDRYAELGAVPPLSLIQGPPTAPSPGPG